MTEKRNIGTLKHCYGCGVCVKACPVKIIDLVGNEDGFYSPKIINQDKCIECRLCLDVCAFYHKEVCHTNNSLEYYAGWSNRPIVRQRCSSGGVGFEIASTLFKQGYEACGVRYDIENKRAEHFLAANEEGFSPSIGSKYIPSYTIDGLKGMTRTGKYLFVGTPCQVDSFRRYIKRMKIENNYVLLDFFCHGVPSMLLWEKYITRVEKEIGPLNFVSWRNKTNGWHDSWSVNDDASINCETVDWHNSYNIKIRGEKHFYQSRWKGGDLFYRFFLGNYCLNHCCYKACKYKLTESAADIRIGDLWGKAYEDNQEGVNGVIALTNKGKELIETLDHCSFEKVNKGDVLHSQMSHSPTMPIIYQRLLNALRSNKSLEEINSSLIKIYRTYTIPKRAINMLCYKFGVKPLFH